MLFFDADLLHRSDHCGGAAAIDLRLGEGRAAGPHGVIHAETQPFTEVDSVVAIRVARFPTWYARFGDWFVALCAAGLLAGWARTRHG